MGLSAPQTHVVVLRLSATLAEFAPFAEQPIANGDDWLEFAPAGNAYANDDGAPEALALADPRTGRVSELTLPNSLEIGTPLSLGPDGNVWFAAENPRGDVVLGELSADARMRLLVPKTPVPGQPMGVASGSDGALWLMTTTQQHVTRLTRVNIQTGQTHTYGLAHTLPLGLLLPAVGGGFWANLAAGGGGAQLIRINTHGQVLSRINTVVTPATLDGDGAVWGADRYAGGDLERVAPSGQVSQVTWYAPQPDRVAGVGSVALGSDGRVWFTAGSSIPDASVEDLNPEQESVIGVTGPSLNVQSSPTTFADTGMDPTFPQDGVNYNNPPLVAAPDGHFDTIQYEPSTNTAWSLLSLMLPDQPIMHPAKLAPVSAHVSGTDVAVRLSCAGQPGRICAGTISVEDSAHTVVRQAYGLAPGLSSTHTLSVPRSATVTGVRVTSVDPLARSTQTRSLQLPQS